MWRLLKTRPFIVIFLCACLVLGIAVGAAAFLLVESVTEARRQLVINAGTAGLTLVFVGVLGGFLGALIKLIFDDYQADRSAAAAAQEAERQKQVADHVFFRNILDDLKSVYDTVERARLLIEAHKSAKTYGEQMRELPDAVVVLHNIRRAMRPGYLDLEAEIRPQIDCCIGFLKDVIAEFRRNYIGASRRQSEYEAQKQRYLDKLRIGEGAGDPPDVGTVWSYLEQLPALETLRSDARFALYELRFLNHIDAASYALRARLPGGSAEPEDPVAETRRKSSMEFHARWKASGREGAAVAEAMAAEASSGTPV